MTTALKDTEPPERRRRLSVAAARGVVFWERLWPALLPVLAPAFLVLILSLFGLWRHVPATLHWAVLLLAAAATIAAAFRYGRGLAFPSRREGLARLEADGALRHAPLQALEDRPFATAASPLWRAHLAEMKRRAAAARLRGPRATADARDPFALRFAAPGLLAVALVAAGGEWTMRLGEGLHPGAAKAGAVSLADLWIEPPAYTGKAPIYLLRAGERLAGARDQVDAPVGSAVLVQASGARLSLKTPDEEFIGAREESAAGRTRLDLTESGLLRLRLGGAEGRWPIGAIPDEPPEARFLAAPSTTDDARLALAVAIGDDYGVTGAALEMRLDPDQERPLDAPPLDEASIRERKTIPLEGFAGKGERRVDLDLQSDPWAGLMVIARIVVTDGAGQSAATEETSFRLPARPFFNPLARAVIEQRQTLAVAAKDWPRAGRSFDALTLAPEFFYDKPTDYLLIRTAFWRVMRDKGEGLDDTVGAFWPLALQLEDEALDLARRRLEAARDALREALERGAGADEIARLVEEMRAAMQAYLQALAQSGERLAENGEGGGELVNPGDLDSMLDSIRDLAQSGAEGAARQALADLENILNNLRLSSRGQGRGGEGAAGEGQGGAAGAAGDLIGRQRDLANRAFERGKEPGANGQGLAGEEGGLADDLSRLMDELKAGGGPDPKGEGAKALGEALGAMREAEDALKADDFGAASGAMERAIARLRDGAQSLAESRARAAQGNGENGRRGPALDPLGRPVGEAYGTGVDVPEKWDAARAREVLEELRRRLSDGKRTQEEIRYLERLLQRF